MVTMKQIAAHAGVSQSAVSLALGDGQPSRFLSAATRQRIRDAAQELGYQPNHVARAMVTGQTNVIGFLSGSIRYEYMARMLNGALNVAQQNGYLVKVLLAGEGTSTVSALHKAIQQRLAGVICAHTDEAFLKLAHAELSRHSMPLAMVDHTIPNLGTYRAPGIRVVSDDAQGMGDAVAHLTALGHSRIAILSSSGLAAGWRIREDGYRRAMRKAKLPVHEGYVQHADGTSESYRHITQGLLAMPQRPTAIVCVTDMIAMEVLRIARHAGLRVPEDLSVIGFADLEMARLGDPPLTTVAQPFDQMGEIAAKRLLSAIEAKPKAPASRPSREVLPTRLIGRKSTGPVNATAGRCHGVRRRAQKR